MTYEEAVKVFAAETFEIPVEWIVAAEIEMDSGSSCPTCGGIASIELVAVIGTQHVKRGLAKSSTKTFYDIGDVVRPLVEITQRGDA